MTSPTPPSPPEPPAEPVLWVTAAVYVARWRERQEGA